jgi:transposase
VFATNQVPGRRCWAIEGAGSFGGGHLPGRPRRAGGGGAPWAAVGPPLCGKSDALDAVHIARDALVQAHPVVVRRRGDREALRVLLTTRGNAVNARIQTVSQLKVLIVSASEELRAELRGRGTKAEISYCATLRRRPARSLSIR